MCRRIGIGLGAAHAPAPQRLAGPIGRAAEVVSGASVPPTGLDSDPKIGTRKGSDV
ncbi:hypothetical protein GCM10009834_35520 [Streptomonospora arabica]